MQQYRYRHRREVISPGIKHKLPQINKLIKIYARDYNGNEKKIVKIGRIYDYTKSLMLFMPLGSTYTECFAKSDLENGIYLYQYIE